MEEITYEFKIKTPMNETDSTMNTLILQFNALQQDLDPCIFDEFHLKNINTLIDRMITNLNYLKYKEVE